MIKGRKLKNYDKYFNILESFANSMGISIRVEPCDTLGSYVYSRKCIIIDDALTESEEISTLLHELGHAFDIMISEQKDLDVWSKAYLKYPKVSKKEMNIVVTREQLAWDYGRHIATQLDIKLGKWYHDDERDCIKYYKNG